MRESEFTMAIDSSSWFSGTIRELIGLQLCQIVVQELVFQGPGALTKENRGNDVVSFGEFHVKFSVNRKVARTPYTLV